jgi:hypothetical protein
VRLGFKIEGRLLAPGFYGWVVRLRLADGNLVAGEVGDAGQREAQLVVQGRGRLVQLIQLFLEGAGLIHHGRRVLAGLFQGAHLLAQLITASLETLSQGDGRAAVLVKGAEIAQQSSRVRSARTQFLFNEFQIVTDKTKIEHRTTRLLDWMEEGTLEVCGHPPIRDK